MVSSKILCNYLLAFQIIYHCLDEGTLFASQVKAGALLLLLLYLGLANHSINRIQYDFIILIKFCFITIFMKTHCNHRRSNQEKGVMKTSSSVAVTQYKHQWAQCTACILPAVCNGAYVLVSLNPSLEHNYV